MNNTSQIENRYLDFLESIKFGIGTISTESVASQWYWMFGQRLSRPEVQHVQECLHLDGALSL